MIDPDLENSNDNSMRKIKVKKQKSASIDGAKRKITKISREDRRTIYVISQALDQMPFENRMKLLSALNIDHQSLIPKSEYDFKNESQSAFSAQTLQRYHQQRLVQNYRKLKEFMDKTQKRQGQGNSLYLSKEGNRMLERRSTGQTEAAQSINVNRTFDDVYNKYDASYYPGRTRGGM